MVFWVICEDAGSREGRRRFGPYESEDVAFDALRALRRRFLHTTARGFQVVLDYV
jgi:hypothetical protein